MLNREALGQLKLHKKSLAVLLVLSIVSTALTIAQAYGIATLIYEAFWLDYLVEEMKQSFMLTFFVIMLRAVSIYLQEKQARKLGGLVKLALREKVISKILALGMAGKERHGEVLHLLTDGLEHVEEYIVRYVPQLMYVALVPLMMAIAIIDSVPWISIILMVTYPLIPFFMILIGKAAGKLNQQQWDRMNFLSGHFLDVLKGMATLKIFDRSREQFEVIARLSGEFRDSTLRVLRIAFLSAFVLELISTISTALIAVYTGIALLYGELTFFPAFFVLLLAPEFYLPLRQLGTFFHTGMAGDTALKELVLFLSQPIEEPDEGHLTIEEPIEEIRFQEVDFTYAGREERAAKALDFVLKKNTCTLVMGESGAGKSTLVQLLLRLLSPQQGDILVNGISLQELKGKEWRKHITYLSQRPHLFKGTIKDNIAFGRECTMEDIEAAVKLAKADAFISKLPQGYDTYIGEGGLGLSGGEKQRLAIARALLKPAEIIIFDEATAHLDVETEQALEEGLSYLMKQRIVLIISHRFYHVRRANQILMMEKGAIIEQGNSKTLLASSSALNKFLQEGGLYYESL